MPKQDQETDISRPVTLYVEKVETRPTLDHFIDRRRVSVIDIEVDAIQAVNLIEYFRERIQQGNSGSIRVRLFGRLVHL